MNSSLGVSPDMVGPEEHPRTSGFTVQGLLEADALPSPGLCTAADPQSSGFPPKSVRVRLL